MSAHPAEFLVSHGCMAALSRCRDEAGLLPQRGNRVVIRSIRGLEIGEVLCEATPASAGISAGTLLRSATSDDEGTARQLMSRGFALLDDAQELLNERDLPLVPLDAELLLDGTQGILHVLRWDACTLTPFLEELRQRHGLLITLQDLTKSEPEYEHGCDSCGADGCGSCGEGGCSTGGCGSGNCSRGSVHSAEELTAYFAQLREQMLAAMPRVPLA
jgi:hypothetical protein